MLIPLCVRNHQAYCSSLQPYVCNSTCVYLDERHHTYLLLSVSWRLVSASGISLQEPSRGWYRIHRHSNITLQPWRKMRVWNMRISWSVHPFSRLVSNHPHIFGCVSILWPWKWKEGRRSSCLTWLEACSVPLFQVTDHVALRRNCLQNIYAIRALLAIIFLCKLKLKWNLSWSVFVQCSSIHYK